jgi:hypothetical protein
MADKKINLQSIILIIAIVAFGWSFISYQNAKQEIAYLTDPEAKEELNQQEIAQVVAKVGRLMVLPEDEEPVVATITDAAALSEQQEFFKGATDGDKVVIYKSKAVIYNPERNLIVNVGPVNIQGATASTVEVRNGSETQGAALEVADDLKESGYIVNEPQFASRSDYSDYLLVNLSGKNVSALEEQYGVTAITELPEGEANSQADIVLIIGN